MSLTMHIYNTKEVGFDVSELVHDIEYTTSILGQAGKLTFTLEKDPTPNSEFQIDVGSLVKFWHSDNDEEEEKPIFLGHVFCIGTDRSEAYKVTAYDNLRYLQNHDDMCIENETIKDVFNIICDACDIPKEKRKIIGNIDESIKVQSKNFVDTSYFDILQYAIDWTNSYALTSEVEKLQDIKLNDIVNFAGGNSWTSPNDLLPANKTNREGKAKVTVISLSSKHQYHLIGLEEKVVHGWVDKKQIISDERMNQLLDNFYFIRDNFGTLELREIKYCGTYDDKGNKLDDWLIIGNDSLLTEYQYEVDIDKNTFNEFYFQYNPKDKSNNKSSTNKQVQEKTLIGAIQAGTLIKETGTILDNTVVGDNTIPKWGKLRKYVNVSDISDKELLAEYMRINIEHFNKPTRSMKLSAIGYDGVYAGDTFHLHLNKLDLNCAVYVLNATHHYNGNLHTMDLEINTSPDMEVFC